MNNQRGFYDFDFISFAIVLVVVGMGLGIALCYAIDHVWPIVKAWIHTITA